MEQPFAHSRMQERRYLVILALVIVLLGSVYPFLMQADHRASTDLRASLDVLGSLLGLIAGLALVAHFYSLGDRLHLFLGLAFFIGATMDLVSGLLAFASTRGWVGWASGHMQRCIITAHVVGRLLMGLIVVLAPSVMRRMGKLRSSQSEAAWVTLPVLLLSAVAAVLVFKAASTGFAKPEQILSRPVDFLLGLLFAAALVILVLEYHARRDMLTWWVALSIGVATIAQFMMSFSKELFDTFDNVAHAYKTIAYVVPIVGFPICQIATALERRQALHALQEQRSIFRTVLANTPDLIALKDLHFVYQAANAAFCEFVGREERDVLGATDFHLFPAEQAEGFRRGDEAVVESGRSQIQDQRASADGSGRWFHLLRAPVRDGEGNMIAILSSVRDITDLKQLEERLRVMSHTDELTRLYNRRGVLVVGEQMLKKAERNRWRAVLVFLDLDNMKQINDTYGHEEGDRALTEAAAVLKGTVRESDVIARVGGDEFVILAVETSMETERNLLDRLAERLRAWNARSDRPYELSLSVGVAHYDPAQPRRLAELLSEADRLMYEHKRSKQKT